MKNVIFALSLMLSLSSAAQAGWSCECEITEEDGTDLTIITDGETEKDARFACTRTNSSNPDEAEGTVVSCSSNGRGDR